MTLEEEQALMINYFQNHPLDIQEASISDEGTMHVKVNLDGLKYIDPILKKILETNHYKGLVRMGYTHGRSKGSNYGGHLLYSDNIVLPRHYYCDDQGEPLSTKVIDGGWTAEDGVYQNCPGPIVNNPSSGQNFTQNGGACLPTIRLFQNAIRNNYDQLRADKEHDPINGYIIYDGDLGYSAQLSFFEERDHAAQTMYCGMNQIEFEGTAIICFELVYSTKVMVQQNIKPVHLLYQLGPGNTGVSPVHNGLVTKEGTRINKYVI